MVNLSASNTTSNHNVTSPLPSLDAPSADEEPGSTRPRLHRLVSTLNRYSPLFCYLLFTIVVLSCISTTSATPTSTVAVAVERSNELGWTSLVKRATTDSAAAAATCACSASEGDGGTKHDAAFIVKSCLIPVLVLLSGAAAGLTIGFMTLDTTQLQVLIKSGSPQQQEWATKVLPLRKNGHLLLITLLLSNMIFNEALPVIAESVFGGGIQAVVASTAMIVIFAEIIPQTVCSRYGLRIGAAMVIPVRIMIYILFIVAWPTAKLLEWLLGPHDGIIYRRTELKELVALHAESAGRHGDLEVDTVAIVGATLDLQAKTVRDAMTPVSSLFSLPVTAKLDYETLGKILEAGHSRIPVYEEVPVESTGGGGGEKKRTRKKIIGVLLTKQLILLDPEDATPLRDIPINPLPLVADDLALLQILNTFQEGRSHMAVVCRRKFNPASVPTPLETIPSGGTISDTDLERGESGTGKSSSTEGFFHNLFHRKRSGSGSTSSSTTAATATANEKMISSEKPSLSSLNLAAELDDEFPQGIITLEDVLEELIGEEILDESDRDGSHQPSMTYYIPPEAQGRVGHLSGPPPAPSALIAQQVKQKSTSSKGGIVGAVGRISIGRSRSAPGQRRSGDKSGTSSGTTTPKDDNGGNLSSIGGGGPLGGVFGAFGGGGGGSGSKKRSQSPSQRTVPLPDTNTPRAVDSATFDQSPTIPTTSLTGQPQVEEPQSLDSIDETVSPVPTTSSSSHPPPAVRPSTAANLNAAPAPSPSLLSDAVLLERGRRLMIAKGSDPSQLSLANLRLSGVTRSQPGSRSNTPVPASPSTQEGSTGGDVRSASASSRAPRGAFKTPTPSVSALPQAAKVTMSKDKVVERGDGGGDEEAK
ncbi:hypothetical protein JCM16303_005838 [Sporobolomyces ruberrimus]